MEFVPGHELDRLIAEMRGYQIYHYDKDHESQCYYMLMDETFDSVVTGDVGRFGDEMVKRGFHAGERKTEAEAWQDVPPFSQQFQYAMMLTEDSQRFTLQKRDGQWVASFDYQMLFTGDDCESYYDRELAICAAWIKWAKSKEKSDGSVRPDL